MRFRPDYLARVAESARSIGYRKVLAGDWINDDPAWLRRGVP
jgi:hypothetical protein